MYLLNTQGWPPGAGDVDVPAALSGLRPGNTQLFPQLGPPRQMAIDNQFRETKGGSEAETGSRSHSRKGGARIRPEGL